MSVRLLATIALLVSVMLAPATASEKKPAGDVETFCKAVSDVVREREFERRKQELEALKAEINERIGKLEALKSEVTTWQQRRDDFAAKAREGLVGIYLKMKPDAAAAQLSELDGGLAAAILMKMAAGKAGLILSEMPADKAALIAGIMAAAADTDKRS